MTLPFAGGETDVVAAGGTEVVEVGGTIEQLPVSVLGQTASETPVLPPLKEGTRFPSVP